jgi:hypothetical protein
MVVWGNTVKWSRFIHMLRLFHLNGNRKEPDKIDENYDIVENEKLF